VTVLAGFPVVRPERIPFDLAATVHPGRVERVVDDLWSRRLLTGATLHRVLGELAGRGRPGLAVMRALLQDRPPGWVPPASGLESRVASQLRRHGLPAFDRQVDVGGDVWVGRVDFLHRPSRVVLEVQSDRYHAALSDRRADERRLAALRAAGWLVVEVLESEVWARDPTWLGRLRHHLTMAAQAS
jgi:very-short-patch-repair endonuclease